MGGCHSSGRSKRKSRIETPIQITVCTQTKEEETWSPPNSLEIRRKRRKFKGRTNTPGSLRSSRRYYKEAIVRKNLELERHDSQASLIPRLFLTPSGLRRNQRTKKRPTEKGKSRKAKQKQGVKLSKKLKALSREQLAELILQISNANPQIEKEFHDICPKPDLLAQKRKLTQLLDAIYKAFPKCHIGSMRDSYCFERVVSHIHAFKNECSTQCEQFYSYGVWQNVIDYILMAWPLINRLPEWNNDDHNIIKRSIVNHFVTRMRAAIRVQEFISTEEICSLKNRLEEALKLDRSIETALEDVRKISS